MNKRMIMNDLRSNRMVSAATFIFMAVTAMLLGLSIFLFASLSDSIDKLMTEAETPDFLQMHTGELDEEQLISFSQQREDVEVFQVCTFLNLQNSQFRSEASHLKIICRITDCAARVNLSTISWMLKTK